MIELAASFDEQFASIAPFVLYLIIGAIVFVETGILFGFFLPGDSILFSAGLVAAAEAIADCVSPEQLNASFIVPSVFDPNVTKAVAAAVKKSV